MDFEEHKKVRLNGRDRSKKGSVDKHIKTLVGSINEKDNFYTTSSCSGRILLIVRPESGRKCDTEWLFVSHDIVSSDKLIKALKNLPEEDVWLRQESFILHVCCKSIDDAGKLLDWTWKAGLKRSGITSIKKRIIVEIMGTDYMDTLVAKKGKLIVSEDYLKTAVSEANARLERNFKRIKRLEKEIKK